MSCARDCAAVLQAHGCKTMCKSFPSSQGGTTYQQIASKRRPAQFEEEEGRAHARASVDRFRVALGQPCGLGEGRAGRGAAAAGTCIWRQRLREATAAAARRGYISARRRLPPRRHAELGTVRGGGGGGGACSVVAVCKGAHLCVNRGLPFALLADARVVVAGRVGRVKGAPSLRGVRTPFVRSVTAPRARAAWRLWRLPCGSRR